MDDKSLIKFGVGALIGYVGGKTILKNAKLPTLGGGKRKSSTSKKKKSSSRKKK